MDIEKLKNLTILYVEDDKDVRDQTTIILNDFVKKIIVAQDGEEALKIIKQNEVDLIITDIQMPKKSGIDFIKEYKNCVEYVETPIIITTAYTETNYLIEAIRLRVDGYVIKPINIKELLSSMYSCILPYIQKKELLVNQKIFDAISIFVGGKKIEIIKYLIQHVNDENMFYGAYEDIMEDLNVSKPTVVKTFRQLIEANLLVKIRNKQYKINWDNIPI